MRRRRIVNKVQSLPQKIHPLLWRHNGRDCVSNHQPHDCLLNRLFRRRSKKTPKLRVTGLCAGGGGGGGGDSPVAAEFPAQMTNSAENVSIWWRHHGKHTFCTECLRCLNISSIWATVLSLHNLTSNPRDLNIVYKDAASTSDSRRGPFPVARPNFLLLMMMAFPRRLLSMA